MANVRNSNSFYIDTQYSSVADSLVLQGVRVLGVVVTATSANGRIVLSDETSGVLKLDLRVATSGDSVFFRFDQSPIRFPNGIRPTTLSNAVATVIIQEN